VTATKAVSRSAVETTRRRRVLLLDTAEHSAVAERR